MLISLLGTCMMNNGLGKIINKVYMFIGNNLNSLVLTFRDA
jgi:hypothetical protein